MHPHDAEQRGVRDGDWVRLASRAGETTLRALITERVAPGVVYTTFHHPDTQANVITTDYSDWATNCPEYKVTAVQISPSNGPSEWQKAYDEQARHSRRIAPSWKPRNSRMHDPVRTVDRQVWRDSGASKGMRIIPEETALALTYNGGTYAVMMGTPRNLRDFAVGFSLSEGIVQSADDICSLDIVHLDDGIELRMWLKPEKADRLNERRRHIAGPTGCGICGIESIAEAVRPAAIVASGPVILTATDHGSDAGHPAAASRSISKPARCMPRRSGRRGAAS